MNKKIKSAVTWTHCKLHDVRSRLLFLMASLALGFGFVPAYAIELGHSRVVSAPGEALVVEIPVLELTEADVSSLSIGLADSSQWQAAGLTPPVALDSLSIRVQAGRNESERLVRVSSEQVSERTVIDMLIDVSTSSANRVLQTSIIVPPPPSVRLAGQTIVVQRGDTLIGIAEQFPVQGANLYQELWALYSGNTDAFMRENMNLLKAGVSLRIPDADAVRAIDPAFAKAQYLAHVRAFRQGTGASTGDQGVPAQAQAETLQTEPEQTQRGEVESAPAEPPAPVDDQVRLTAAESTGPAAQADVATSTQKQRIDEVDRQQALEQNIRELQSTIAQLQGEAADANAGVEKSAPNGERPIDQGQRAVGQTAGEPTPTGQIAASRSGVGAGVTDASRSASESGDGLSTGDRATEGSGAGATATNSTETHSAATGSADVSDADAGIASGQTGSSGSAMAVKNGSVNDDKTNEPITVSNAFERLSQWISDNTTAAIALVLALIALILAWALRSGKDKNSERSDVKPRLDTATAKFEEKLREIDLSLDDPTEQKPAKPDQKG